MQRKPKPAFARKEDSTDHAPRRGGSGLGASRPVGLKTNDSIVSFDQVEELLCQALETEIGGVRVYEVASRCARNPALRREWGKYLAETRHHEEVLRNVFRIWGLDPETQTPGRAVVKHMGEALVAAMEMALRGASKGDAELVAAECVVLAETKDHMNWELIGEACKAIPGPRGKALKMAYDEIEDEEDEHLYHTTGWTRELWLASLGLPAVLPPPEEVQDVKTAIGAARAKQGRSRMTPKAAR